MTHYDVKRLALILAIQAEIEGMKAENQQRERLNQSVGYTDAAELRNLAYAHDEKL